jgi:hypothetical protein
VKKVTPTNSEDAAPKSWWKSKVTKWIYPDAAEANEGQKMEAYFDKDKGRWVFPDDDPNALESVADSAPPPPPAAMKAAASTPNLSSADSSGGSDPLAALMMPPKRAMPSASNSSDPLSALMQPPQRAASFTNRAISAPAGKTGNNAPPMFFNPAAAKK